ncbi:MAG: DUF4342 domain-containing protein [Anaerolineae bacterium]|mgnify:CR=1 FL=1|jgi:hypothetical protein|nr:DUF4342 domain-containing protein [Chloroflexota bacterium]
MPEPFELDDQPTTPEQPRAPKQSLWDTINSLASQIWKTTFLASRGNETVVQLPLILAVLFVLVFPHLAAVAVVLMILLGFKIQVLDK